MLPASFRTSRCIARSFKAKPEGPVADEVLMGDTEVLLRKLRCWVSGRAEVESAGDALMCWSMWSRDTAALREGREAEAP